MCTVRATLAPPPPPLLLLLLAPALAVPPSCEIVWVRCAEPIPAWLPDGAQIVEKCGEVSDRSVLSVHNVGDEGFGCAPPSAPSALALPHARATPRVRYLEWLVHRYDSLPACVLLLHGAHHHMRVAPADLLGSLRPSRELAALSLAVPLGDIFVERRVLHPQDVGRGVDVFYRHLQAHGLAGRDGGLPDIRGEPLSLWCCNTWLLTHNAIRARPLGWWVGMLSAAKLPVAGHTASGTRYAVHGGAGAGRHPEVGVIYEHAFHLMLGYALNATRSDYERDFRDALSRDPHPACAAARREGFLGRSRSLLRRPAQTCAVWDG
jgi:hypothetical protein